MLNKFFGKTDIQFQKLAKYTIAIWAVSVCLYSFLSVSEMMAFLKESPSQDLYANSLGFQIIAFIFTKGLASIVVLGLVLNIELLFIKKK